MFIRAKGYEILVSAEISKFLLSFTGIFMVIAVMTLALLLIYYEFTVILLILDSSKKKGKTKLLLEFKSHGQEKASIIDKTIEVLEKEGILDETIFHTSNIELINEFNENHEDLDIGYVFIGKIGTFSARKMAKMPVDFISAEESLVTKNMIREVHKAGKPVFVWTINDDYKAERLLELGVDGLITYYPMEMVELRDRYQDYFE